MSEYTLLRSKIEEADDADEVMEILRLEGDTMAQKHTLTPELLTWLDKWGYSIVPTHNAGKALVRDWNTVEQSDRDGPKPPRAALEVMDRVSYRTGPYGPQNASQIGQGRILEIWGAGERGVLYLVEYQPGHTRTLDPTVDQITKLD